MAKKYKPSKDLRAAIIAHAWKNPEFKAKLLKNPRAAFKEMGVDFPQGIEVRVVEEKGNSFTFVLPRPVAEATELSEKDLQKLAAGKCFTTPIGSAVADAFNQAGRAVASAGTHISGRGVDISRNQYDQFCW